ncbi:MAG: alpha/beta fold hydrolase [Lapillicoccus sp.]
MTTLPDSRHTVTDVLTADLRWDSTPADPAAVVLVLHGGQEHSTAAAGWWQLPVLRMLPIARNLVRVGDGRLAVLRIRYAVRGWNDDLASPLRDTQAALDLIAARYPGLPLVLAGHSMGGRVALHLMGDERVSAVVGLAPWIERGDAYQPHDSLQLLIVHGLSDRITSPTASRALVERLQGQGRRASFIGLSGEKHAMLRRRRTWDQLTMGFVAAVTGAADQAPVDESPDDGSAALGARASSEALLSTL